MSCNVTLVAVWPFLQIRARPLLLCYFQSFFVSRKHAKLYPGESYWAALLLPRRWLFSSAQEGGMACLRVSSMLLPLAAAIVCVHEKNCVACVRRVWTFNETRQVIEHRSRESVSREKQVWGMLDASRLCKWPVFVTCGHSVQFVGEFHLWMTCHVAPGGSERILRKYAMRR